MNHRTLITKTISLTVSQLKSLARKIVNCPLHLVFIIVIYDSDLVIVKLLTLLISLPSFIDLMLSRLITNTVTIFEVSILLMKSYNSVDG